MIVSQSARAVSIALSFVAMAACGGGGGESLGPGNNPEHPHEPAGMTVGFDEPFTLTPVGQPVTGWFVESNPENISVINDGSAPKSGGSVLQLKFPSGFGGGNAPMLINWNESGHFPPNDGVLYIHMWLKVSANWSNNGNGGTKFIWPRAGESTNHFAPINFQSNAIRTGLALQGAYLNGVDHDYIEDGTHSLGAWHEIEWLLVQGTSASANNGVAKVWVDGTQVVDVANVKMLPNGQALGWTFLAINPTFGYGPNNVPHDQYIWIDHLYASVR